MGRYGSIVTSTSIESPGPLASRSAIKNTFRDLRTHGPTSIFTGAILAVPVLLAALFRATLTGRAATTTTFIFFLTAYLTGLWLTVAITLATFDYATGKDLGVGDLLKTSFDFRKIGSYFLASILFALVLAGVVLAALIPFIGSVFSTLAGADWNFQRLTLERQGPIVLITGVLSVVAAAVLFVMIYLRFGAFAPASILEGRGPAGALRRSTEITRRHRLDFFVLWIFLGLIGLGVFLVIGGPGMIVGIRRPSVSMGWNPFDPYAGMDRAQILVSGFSSYLFQTLWAPFVAAAVTNFFLELRGRSSFDGMNRGEPLPGGESQPDSEKQEQATGQDRNSRNLVE